MWSVENLYAFMLYILSMVIMRENLIGVAICVARVVRGCNLGGILSLCTRVKS